MQYIRTAPSMHAKQANCIASLNAIQAQPEFQERFSKHKLNGCKIVSSPTQAVSQLAMILDQPGLDLENDNSMHQVK